MKRIWIDHYKSKDSNINGEDLKKLLHKLSDSGTVDSFIIDTIESNSNSLDFFEKVSVSSIEYDEQGQPEEYLTSDKGKMIDRIDCNFTLNDVEAKIRKIDPAKPKAPILYYLPNKYNWQCWLKANWWLFALVVIAIIFFIYQKRKLA